MAENAGWMAAHVLRLKTLFELFFTLETFDFPEIHRTYALEKTLTL
jgi:hypothetical protein